MSVSDLSDTIWKFNEDISSLISIPSTVKRHGVSGSSYLPDEYVEVEYVESHQVSGSAGIYIDTGIIPLSDEDPNKKRTGVSIGLMPTTLKSSQNYFFGAQGATSGPWFTMEYNSTSSRYTYFNLASTHTLLGANNYLSVNSYTAYRLNFARYSTGNRSFRYSVSYSTDDSTWSNIQGGTIFSEGSDVVYNSTQHICIFTNGLTNTAPSSERVYFFRVFLSGTDSFSAPDFDFVPCYRKSDGEIGFYEIKNGEFYCNTQIGISSYFTAGPPVIRENYEYSIDGFSFSGDIPSSFTSIDDFGLFSSIVTQYQDTTHWRIAKKYNNIYKSAYCYNWYDIDNHINLNGWVGEKTTRVTGGTSSSASILINWFESNATRVDDSSTIDLRNTVWKINDDADFGSAAFGIASEVACGLASDAVLASVYDSANILHQKVFTQSWSKETSDNEQFRYIIFPNSIGDYREAYNSSLSDWLNDNATDITEYVFPFNETENNFNFKILKNPVCNYQADSSVLSFNSSSGFFIDGSELCYEISINTSGVFFTTITDGTTQAYNSQNEQWNINRDCYAFFEFDTQDEEVKMNQAKAIIFFMFVCGEKIDYSQKAYWMNNSQRLQQDYFYGGDVDFVYNSPSSMEVSADSIDVTSTAMKYCDGDNKTTVYQ